MTDDVEAALERLRAAMRQSEGLRRRWCAVEFDDAELIERHIAALRGERDRLTEQTANVASVLARYQPAGSPPPGDLSSLAEWAFAAQAQEIERLRGLLREHEWCWIGNYDSATVCAHCLSDMADSHAPDCPMAAALAREAKP